MVLGLITPTAGHATVLGHAYHTLEDPSHTVGAVLQPGYQLGGVLIRPARVAVLTWQEGRPQDGGAGSPRPRGESG